MITLPRRLTFAELDDLSFAAERGRLNHQGLSLAADDLGPVFELGLLAKSGLIVWPGTSGWLALDAISPLFAALASRKHRWTCPRTRMLGVYRTYERPTDEGASWIEFGYAAQYAARQAGFPNDIAAQLVGAIGELQSNIYEHSQTPDTGIVAFRAMQGIFEFIVCDRGIGVLKSLQSCSEYAGLSDYGQALKLTVSDGVSRHGAHSGRGFGFRPLFTGLANLHGHLRFRSGDHALTMDGRNPLSIPAKVGQKPSINGFLIAVMCQWPEP